MIEIEIDRAAHDGPREPRRNRRRRRSTPAAAQALLDSRPPHPGLAPRPDLPDDTRLWAALQEASGGIWAGCVYDVERVAGALDAARER